jgi:predicted anti-sigma-YlaC factor YlaD
MVKMKQGVEQHVGEQLSGFLDGELTQQDRQIVSLHCDECSECRENLARLRELRERIGNSHLSEVGEDKWRETMNDSTVEITRGIGWLVFLTGLLIVAIYGGLALLLFSVLRQRLIERKTDKYKDVEI